MNTSHLFIADVAQPHHARRLLVTMLALLCAVALALPAFAAPGGNGKGGGPKATSGEAATTLVAAPDVVQAGGETFELSGCGYDTSKGVDFVVHTDYNMWFWSVPVDADGCILDTQRSERAGTYLVEAYQDGNGKKSVLMASTELTVVG